MDSIASFHYGNCGGHYITMLLADCITIFLPFSFYGERNEASAKFQKEKVESRSGFCRVWAETEKRVLWYQVWDQKTCWCFNRMLQSSSRWSIRLKRRQGFGELSFPFMQEPTEKQPLRGHEQVQHGCLYVSGDRKPAHYTK